MEDYPELVNNPSTPNYDENSGRLLEIWTNGGHLDPAETDMLLEAFPELSEAIGRNKTGTDAA